MKIESVILLSLILVVVWQIHILRDEVVLSEFYSIISFLGGLHMEDFLDQGERRVIFFLFIVQMNLSGSEEQKCS